MPELLSGLTVTPCTQTDFDSVVRLINELQLDNNDLKHTQFLVVKDAENVIGFGRLRNYDDCCELCSLGVIEPYRNRGVGTQLAKALIKNATKTLYVVTIIPEFFGRLGFIQTAHFPSEIGVKISYCTGSLPVEETYVAMQLK